MAGVVQGLGWKIIGRSPRVKPGYYVEPETLQNRCLRKRELYLGL